MIPEVDAEQPDLYGWATGPTCEVAARESHDTAHRLVYKVVADKVAIVSINVRSETQQREKRHVRCNTFHSEIMHIVPRQRIKR